MKYKNDSTAMLICFDYQTLTSQQISEIKEKIRSVCDTKEYQGRVVQTQPFCTELGGVVIYQP